MHTYAFDNSTGSYYKPSFCYDTDNFCMQLCLARIGAANVTYMHTVCAGYWSAVQVDELRSLFAFLTLVPFLASLLFHVSRKKGSIPKESSLLFLLWRNGLGLIGNATQKDPPMHVKSTWWANTQWVHKWGIVQNLLHMHIYVCAPPLHLFKASSL